MIKTELDRILSQSVCRATTPRELSRIRGVVMKTEVSRHGGTLAPDMGGRRTV